MGTPHVCWWFYGVPWHLSSLEACPECVEPCYDQKNLDATNGIVKIPSKVFTMFSVVPSCGLDGRILRWPRKCPTAGIKLTGV